MPGDTPALDAYVEISAQLLGFSLETPWKQGTRANLETIFKLAALIDTFELPDDIEPAPVFEA